MHQPHSAHPQVLPIKLTGALLALMSFWLCCRLSFLLPSSVRSDWVAKLGNWHCRVCLWWCGFWRVTWIKVGQQANGGDNAGGAKAGSGGGGRGGKRSSGSSSEAMQPVGIVSNHISWCDILIHMSHSFPSFVARSQTRKTPIIGIIRWGWGGGWGVGGGGGATVMHYLPTDSCMPPAAIAACCPKAVHSPWSPSCPQPADDVPLRGQGQ